MTSRCKGVLDGVSGIMETGIAVGLAIPIANNVISSIDRITNLIQKARFNKALCKFIGERLDYAKSILKDSDNINKEALERYSELLNEIKDGIEGISGSKQGFKAWMLTKKIITAKEAEEKLVLLYKKLDAANNDLYFSVLRDTHRNVKEMKDEIPEQLQKLIQILTMKLDIDNRGWKPDDIILDNKKISELRNQPQVIRGKIEKKKYLTQDIAQKPLDTCDGNSCKNINMLKLLSDCKNVIKFFGIYKLRGDQYLITEWCEHGNLEEYLLRNPELDWNIKVNIATGIANGLVFCHDRDILHHDIRSSNIMLDAYLCAKLSNFELSRREQDNTVPGLSLVDTARYLAPEKLKNKENPYTKECDIFSFGIVLWVIAMQAKPYADMKSFKQIEDFVLGGNRPGPADENIPIKYKKIMERAWDHNSNNRPEANKVYEKLSKCLEDDDIYPVNDNETVNSAPVLDISDAQRDEDKMYEQAVNYHSKNNREEAWSIFCELALSGHKESLYYLGYYYEHGYVVSKDNKESLKYYKESADKGCNRAAYFYAEACLKLAHEYMEKAAQLKQFKAGVKLAEYSFPPLPSRDTCDKLLSYLHVDEDKLQKMKSNESKLYQERIRGLQDKIKQRQKTI